MRARRATINRATRETRITLALNLDGSGKSSLKTGIGFFDHMLALFAKHAVMDLRLKCAGDLEVDAHHTVEDCGIALGQAFAEALGDKRGIRRYGAGFDPRNPFTGEAYVPMALRGGFQRSAVSGLARARRHVATADHPGGADAGHVERVPVRSGEGILPGIRQ
jgi:imidazoleglycerol phosphate dehydratase HisB